MMIWVHGNVMVWVQVDDIGFVTSYGKERPPRTMDIFYLTKKY